VGLTLPLSGRQGACGGGAEDWWRPVHSRGLLGGYFMLVLKKRISLLRRNASSVRSMMSRTALVADATCVENSQVQAPTRG
jgi:hypothetical protein